MPSLSLHIDALTHMVRKEVNNKGLATSRPRCLEKQQSHSLGSRVTVGVGVGERIS